MRIAQVISLTEPQTKLASLLPFLCGTAFALYRYNAFDPLVAFAFFVSFFFIDVGTTSLNNYKDWKRECASGLSNDPQNAYNPITRTSMLSSDARAVMITLFIIGAVAGLALFSLTDIVVLCIGILAFGVAVLYSAGPLPISHTPWGEFFSGVTMGGGIFFIAVYSQVFDKDFLSFTYANPALSLTVNIFELASIILVTLPYICLIANVMLANNLCDVTVDRAVGRRTLPMAIGIKASSVLFVLLLFISYLSIAVGIIFKILPFASIAVFATIPLIVGGTKRLLADLDKNRNFSVSVINLLLIGGILALSVFVQIGIDAIFIK